MATKRTGRGTVLFGLLVLLAGLAGAVVLLLLSQQRDDDAIRDLARAPVGCDTTMAFKDTGTFYVFIEHLGTLDTLEGDCEPPGEYSRDSEDEPRVTITMTDGDGNQIELDRLDDEFTYALDDSFAGTAKRQVEIGSTGNYVVTVDSADNDFVVAVGRDPANAGDTMRVGALAAGIVGAALGLGLVLMGVRRGRRARRLATTYTAQPGWPVGSPAPTAPPQMQPPLTERMPAPHLPGQWSPDVPSGPPVAGPAQRPPSDPHLPAAPPTPGVMAPPWTFAPPEMPILPDAPTSDPIVPEAPDPSPRGPGTDGVSRDEHGDVDADGDFRGDASP